MDYNVFIAFFLTLLAGLSTGIGGNIRISKKSFDDWLDKQRDACQV